MEQHIFPSQPIANADAVVTGLKYRFTLLDPMVLRYEWAADGIFEDRASTFAINRYFPAPAYRVEETSSHLEIITPSFQVSYNKQRFSPHGLSVSFKSKVTMWGADWKFGSPSSSNLGGTARTLDDIDGRCDMGTGVLSRDGHATIDDSESMLFDSQGFVAPRSTGDRIDGYLFVYGHNYKGAIRAFYAISGPQPSLPRWSLGNWWSRFNRYTADSYLELMDQFKHNNIPLAVAVIDMDWHLISDEEVPHAGWTGYTWNRALFPEPSEFAKALHDRCLKMTLNDHPHAGIHHHEDDYQAMAQAISHDTSRNAPILFDPTSSTFLKAYLTILHRNLEKKGCDFWWIDWQQGPISRIPGLDPLWLLNHFHFLDNKLNSPSGDLPLIFSRYAGPGSHRYPVGFSGDSIISWASLAFQPEFTATASNVGYGWWSHDIGGHMHGIRDDELAARWVQLGVFSPILRLHSSNSCWAGKEPWLYSPEADNAMRRSMRLRHRLVPYLYSESLQTNEPLCQPLYWSYPSRIESYNYPNEYTFGSTLLAAPIVQPRDRSTNLASVKLWIPPKRHVDMFTGTVYDGDRELEMYRPLESFPLLACEGSIIPIEGKNEPSNGCKNPSNFEILIVVGQNGRFSIIENERDDYGDGKGKAQRVFDIEWNQELGRLTVKSPVRRRWSFRFVSLLEIPVGPNVFVNGSQVLKAHFEIQKQHMPPGIFITLPDIEADSTITIAVGKNPQLQVLDHIPAMSKLLLQAQIEYSAKDIIWDILRAEQAAVVKLGRLLAAGFKTTLVGPFVELLVADSRPENGGRDTSTIWKINGIHDVDGIKGLAKLGVNGVTGAIGVNGAVKDVF